MPTDLDSTGLLDVTDANDRSFLKKGRRSFSMLNLNLNFWRNRNNNAEYPPTEVEKVRHYF